MVQVPQTIFPVAAEGPSSFDSFVSASDPVLINQRFTTRAVIIDDHLFQRLRSSTEL